MPMLPRHSKEKDAEISFEVKILQMFTFPFANHIVLMLRYTPEHVTSQFYHFYQG